MADISVGRAAGFALEPAKDIVISDGRYASLSDNPWFRLRLDGTRRNVNGFLFLNYVAGRVDDPIRPVMRFWTGPEAFFDHILPAPTDDVGIALAHVPKGCVEIWISPTNRNGPFDFSVLSLEIASVFDVLARALRAPKRLFFALSAGLVRLQAEAELNWRWALGAAPLESYEAWRRARRASHPAAQSFVDADATLRIEILIEIGGAEAEAIDATCNSILAQSYAKAGLRFLGAASSAAAESRRAFWRDRLPSAADGAHPATPDLIACIRAGDVFLENAINAFAASFLLRPNRHLVYSDEIRRRRGAPARRVFKPRWSPTLHTSCPYIGRAAFFRAELLTEDLLCDSRTAEDIVERIAATCGPDEVHAIARPLLELPEDSAPTVRRLDARYKGQPPAVGIVIPTRDRADLLEPCLSSLFERSSYGNFQVVVVDNDSAEARTHQLLAQMQARDRRLRVLPAPGPFNFSALSNAGADVVDADYLLFLNNDTELLTPDWIERLLFFATRPDVGAVGAKLLYPNRRVQHVGVLLGMGGVAGHFGAGSSEQEPGWWARNLVPHEVAAVTGACLMVERRKFDSVGRFDAENLPVDLNDVDLCLRLAERGWRTICQSDVLLIHRQSASRGGGLRLQQVYDRERSYFTQRWRAVIRDDPYFNPGLSLYAYEESLP